jgi:hypothetical protein
MRTILSTQNCVFLLLVFAAQSVSADGFVVPPRDYKGSLEESAQEAIIIFHGSDKAGGATQDLILKIQVKGNAKHFAWIVPFPNEPKPIEKEDAALFRELFNYVEARTHRRRPKSDGAVKSAADSEPKAQNAAVEVLSRQTVGDFDIDVVRENKQAALNPWLEKNGYQEIEDTGGTLEFYRKKKYVFACIKVSSEALATQRSIESHPLRFTFSTGGRDGIYFPMKMTGLQSEPFDVNLYVFFRAWINDKLSRFGYRHRGFELRYRDWDTDQCVANGGKAYSLPEEDPFLSNMAGRLPTVTKFFQKLYPGRKYYLTNIQAKQLAPGDVRQWSDDLWLFPYYTDRGMVPYDARPGGVAHAAYPDVPKVREPSASARRSTGGISWPRTIGLAVILLAGVVVAVLGVRRMADARIKRLT